MRRGLGSQAFHCLQSLSPSEQCERVEVFGEEELPLPLDNLKEGGHYSTSDEYGHYCYYHDDDDHMEFDDI
jgi:hypothetical protein